MTAGELDAAEQAALELGDFAAAVMVERMDAMGARWTKASPSDWVTDVDVAIEAEVRRRLAQRFPQHRCVGEEAGASGPDGAPTWYVDPVDGTSNYAARLPWSAFSLGLVAEDGPQVGVVVDPFRHELFHARLGAGAFLGERPIRVAAGPLAGRLVMCELSGRGRGTLELAERLGREGAIVRVMGSAALSLCQVAAGRAAGVVLQRFHPWDVAAGALLVREAGAALLDGTGTACVLPQRGLVAGAPAVAATLHQLAFAAGE